MGVTIGSQPADPEQVHRSLLAGLLSHIGMRDEARKDYLGARGARFAIFPGSALARKQPAFVMSAELVETSRLWGRVNATIQPEWAEELAVHLVRRSYSEPHWSRKRGEVVAAERVTLYGVPIVAGRTVGYQRVDPEMSRDLFVRHALVEGDWPSRHQFLQHNRQLIEDIRTLENRTRRRDLLVDDDVLFAFYDKRVPAAVTSARHFDAWWKKQRRESPDLLDLQRSDLLRDEAGTPSADAFPTTWTSGAFDLELSYRFEPGAQSDGVTVTIPLPLLGSTAVGGVDWQVPGLRAELVIALLRSLPKNLRREIVPIPDTAAAIIDRLPDEAPAGATALTVLLADELRRTRGVIIGADDWDLDKLPPHLRPNYRVVDGAGRTIGEGRDLAVLQKEFSAELVRTVQQATADLERSPVTADAIGDIPQSVERSVNGLPVIGYPALAEEGATVALRVFDSPQTQQRQMWRGTRRLLLSTVASPMRSLRASLTPRDRLVLGRSRYASLEELLQDSVVAAVEATMLRAGAPAWDQAGFDRLRSQVAEELPARALAVLRAAMQTVQAMQAAELALTGAIGPTVQAVAAAERRHLDGLVPPGFVSAVGADRLANLPRYLKAVEQRLADASRGADRDAERAAPVAVVRKDLDELRTRLGARAETPDIAAALTDIGWQIEELYVSLFAQQLGTARPVSVRRIQDAMDRLDPR
jgi:ATP-dependent helicase HrpA